MIQTAADRALTAAYVVLHNLIDFWGGEPDGAKIVFLLGQMSIRADGPRRVIASLPDSRLAETHGTRLTTQVLDDLLPEFFQTAEIEQRSYMTAVLHLDPLPGEVKSPTVREARTIEVTV
jgi:hypothetical protein